MNKYKLVNENRAEEFIQELDTMSSYKNSELIKIEGAIKDTYFGELPRVFDNTNIIEWVARHISQKWTGTKKEKLLIQRLTKVPETFTVFKSDNGMTHSYDEFLLLCIQYSKLKDEFNKLNKNIEIIRRHQSTNSNTSLNTYLKRDTLNYNQALFLLLGLNPKALIEMALISILDYANHNDTDHMLFGILFNSEEYGLFSSAFRKIDGKNFIIGNIVFTEQLIGWLINKELIETVNVEILSKNTKPQNEYLAWQKNYNLVVALVALESNEEKDLKKILQHDRTIFYQSINSKLMPTYKGGEDKPTPKTLKNNIEEYQKYQKQLEL
jgi:hypothetical protein